MSEYLIEQENVLIRYVHEEQNRTGKKLHHFFFSPGKVLKDDGWAVPKGQLAAVQKKSQEIDSKVLDFLRNNEYENQLRVGGGYSLDNLEIRRFLKDAERYRNITKTDAALWAKFNENVKQFNKERKYLEKGSKRFEKLPSIKAIIDIARIYNYWSASDSPHWRDTGPHPNRSWQKPLQVDMPSGGSLEDKAKEGQGAGFNYYLRKYVNSRTQQGSGATGIQPGPRQIAVPAVLDRPPRSMVYEKSVTPYLAMPSISGARKDKNNSGGFLMCGEFLSLPSGLWRGSPARLRLAPWGLEGVRRISARGDTFAYQSENKKWVFFLDVSGAQSHLRSTGKVEAVLVYLRRGQDLFRVDNMTSSRIRIDQEKLKAAFQKQIDEIEQFDRDWNSWKKQNGLLSSIEIFQKPPKWDSKKAKTAFEAFVAKNQPQLEGWYGKKSAASLIRKWRATIDRSLDMRRENEIVEFYKDAKDVRNNNEFAYGAVRDFDHIRSFQSRLRRIYMKSESEFRKLNIKYPDGPHEGINYDLNYKGKKVFGTAVSGRKSRRDGLRHEYYKYDPERWREVLKDIVEFVPEKGSKMTPEQFREILHNILKRDGFDLKFHLKPLLKKKAKGKGT